MVGLICDKSQEFCTFINKMCAHGGMGKQDAHTETLQISGVYGPSKKIPRNSVSIVNYMLKPYWRRRSNMLAR